MTARSSTAAEGTRLLYECVRNPLAHAFGMSRLDDAGSPIAFLKDPLTAERVAELDLAESRPQGLGPTIRPASPGAPARAYFVAVPALYWGVQRLLRAVLTDEHQLPAAEELAHALVRFLSAPTDSSRSGALSRLTDRLLRSSWAGGEVVVRPAGIAEFRREGAVGPESARSRTSRRQAGAVDDARLASYERRNPRANTTTSPR